MCLGVRGGVCTDTRGSLVRARWIKALFPRGAWIGVELTCNADDAAWLAALERVSGEVDLPLVAAGNVHMHVRSRRPVQDLVTAIRLKRPVGDLGYELYANGEHHLRSRMALAALYPRGLLEQTLVVASQCEFSLDVLRYEYPDEVVPEGHTAASYLRQITEAGMCSRWPLGVPDKVRRLVEHELELIAALGYEPVFSHRLRLGALRP